MLQDVGAAKTWIFFRIYCTNLALWSVNCRIPRTCWSTGGKLPWCGPGLPRSSVNKPTNWGKQNTSPKITIKHQINLISSSSSSSLSTSYVHHPYFSLASCWQYFVGNSSIDGLCIVLSFPCLQLQILLDLQPKAPPSVPLALSEAWAETLRKSTTWVTLRSRWPLNLEKVGTII